MTNGKGLLISYQEFNAIKTYCEGVSPIFLFDQGLEFFTQCVSRRLKDEVEQ